MSSDDAGTAREEAAGGRSATVPFGQVGAAAVRSLLVAREGVRPVASRGGAGQLSAEELAPALGGAVLLGAGVAAGTPEQPIVLPEALRVDAIATLLATHADLGTRPLPALMASVAVATAEDVLAGALLGPGAQHWFAHRYGTPLQLVAAWTEAGMPLVREEVARHVEAVAQRAGDDPPGAGDETFLAVAGAVGFTGRTVLPRLGPRGLAALLRALGAHLRSTDPDGADPDVAGRALPIVQRIASVLA